MKRALKKILGAIAIIILLVNNEAIAATTSELQKERNSTRSKINEAKEQLEDVQAEKTETMKQVEDITVKITDYNAQIDEINSNIVELNTKIEENQEKLNKAQKDYEEQEKLLNERLIASYEAGETSYLDFILSSDSITDLISNYFLVTEVATYDTELMGKIEAQKQEVEKAKQELEESKKQLNEQKANKESIANQLQATKQEKDSYVAKLSESEQNIQKQIDELQNYESSVSSKIKQMQEEYDRQMAAKKSSSSETHATQTNGGTSSHGFGWPVANPSIGTGYGVSGGYWSSGKHTGVDFRASTGTPVFSIGEGQVVDTGYNSAYGNFVEIYHGNGIYSFYAHASKVQVSSGQSVSKGQQIMLSGSSGNVTGPHLHFEIRSPGGKYANCVNPTPYLP